MFSQAFNPRVNLICRKTDLMRLGKEHPKTVGKFLLGGFFWNNGKQTAEQSESQKEIFLQNFNQACQEDSLSIRYVLKVDGTSKGKGVYLLKTQDSMDSNLTRICKAYACVSQEYLEDVCLLASPVDSSAGFKFDFRVYVLSIADAVDPLKQSVYIYKHGFARRCSEIYEIGDMNRRAQITNSALNNPHGDAELSKYVKNILFPLLQTLDEREKLKYPSPVFELEEYDTDSIPCDLPVTMLFEEACERLIKNGSYSKKEVDEANLEVISLVSSLFKSISGPMPELKAPKFLYARSVDLLGLDIIFDAKLKPWLLEVNKFPDMNCYTLEQLRVKEKLIADGMSFAFPGADMQKLLSVDTPSQSIDAIWKELNPDSIVSLGPHPSSSDSWFKVEVF